MKRDPKWSRGRLVRLKEVVRWAIYIGGISPAKKFDIEFLYEKTDKNAAKGDRFSKSNTKISNTISFKEVKMKRCFAVLALAFLAVSFGFGQIGQTGQITVTVVDKDGVPLGGVTVTITSPDMVVARMDRVTNPSGVARFPSLNPGTYEIKCEITGFNTTVRKDIIVNAGITSAIDVDMAEAAIGEEIVVVGLSPTVDRQSTTKTSTLDTNFVANVPASRDLDTLFNMTPGVTAGTAHGSTVRDNAYSVDGVNVTDSTIGMLANDFSLNIAEEVSIQSGGLSAEYGQVRGAVVNVVSKSGGNELHGKVDLFYRGKDFQSNNTKGTPLEGQISGFDYEIEPGLSLGGPIIRDKLWFFANVSFFQSRSYVAGFPYDTPGKQVPVGDTRPYPYLKLTFQPNQDNKFVISYGYSDSLNKNGYASMYDTEATTMDISTHTHIINALYTHFFSSNVFLNVRASAWISGLFRFAKTKTPSFWEYATYRNSGSAGWDDDNPRRHISVEANGTTFLEDFAGSHELKFGASFRRAIEIRECTMHEVPGTMWSFVSTYNGDPYYAYFYDDIRWVNVLRDYGFYVNDTWNPIKNLTVNLGLRFDINQGLWPPQNENEDYYQLPFEGAIKVDRSIKETMTVYNWVNLSPRIGFSYDIFGDGKMFLKGSFAKYTRGNINTWAGRGNPNAWTYFGAYINADYSLYAVDWVQYAGKELAPQYGYKDYDLKSPYTNEFTLGVERELFPDWSVGVRYIAKKEKNIIDDADSNALDLDKLLANGEMDWIGYEPVTAVDPYNGAAVTFYNRLPQADVSRIYLINPPNATTNYSGLEVTLDKRYSNNWQVHASYTYAKSSGLVATDFSATSAWGTGLYQNPNAHINAEGRFPYERRHQLKVSATVKIPFGINLGTYTRFLSGQRYTRTVSARRIGLLTLRQWDETIYAETLGSRGLPALFICDLRAEKEFKLGKITIGLFGEVFNLFNVNKATSVFTDSSNPYYPFEQMSAIQDPRVFRIGARFEL